jgi:hypothetical protein
MLPSLVILAAYCVGRAGRWAIAHTGRPLVGLALGLVLVFPAVKSDLNWDIVFRNDLAARSESPIMAVGSWLEDTYQPPISIQHDPYVYVPQVFSGSVEEWTPTLQEVEQFQPDLIITNRSFFRRFFEDTASGHFLPRHRKAAKEFYQSLLEDGLNGRYEKIKNFDQITVWIRKKY